MPYDFKPFDKRLKEVEEKLVRELKGVRTGRATPTLLDSVMVEAYGARSPISQLASISVEDPKTLRVAPWSASDAKEIENAIVTANLGLSVSSDEKGVRVSFPELTSERRQSLLKLAKEKLEEIRKSLRGARDEVWSVIQKKEKEGAISEDDKFRYKDEMEKKVKASTEQFAEILKRKE